jgi:putative selenium metabolism hydrolase
MINFAQSSAAIADQRDALIDFTQRIVATPSLSGEEGDVAAIIVAELKKLAFDDVWTDAVGNIVGKINGAGGPSVMLNGHMDVVDPGPSDGWPHPAYSGKIVDGHLWGRGSVDMKGPVAAMIYGAACYKKIGVQPAGDVFMTVAVSEEIGGLGSAFLMRDFSADAAIVGEPSRNQLRIGHRGRIELQVKFKGRSAHASAPHLGVNPHFAAAKFLQKLDQLPLADDVTLGPATIAPTLYTTDQVSSNVIPSEAIVFLDWRNVPAETPDHAIAELEKLASGCGDFEVALTRQMRKTYPGPDQDFASIFPPFSTAADHALVKAAAPIIAQATGQTVQPDVWKFATDGGHIHAAGIPVVGFGPGDDALAHTNKERIALADLELGCAIYTPMIAAMMASQNP